MSDRESKLQRLERLSAQRSAERNQIARDVRFLKDSLKPANLLQRAGRSVQTNARMQGDRALSTVRANPRTTAAIAGTLALALLYKPARMLAAKLSDRNQSWAGDKEEILQADLTGIEEEE